MTTRQQAKLQELRLLASETPRFADFEQVDYFDIVKGDTAVVTYFYRSSASFEDVKRFYISALSSRGWNFPHEEILMKGFERDESQRLMFLKGEYTIYINYETAWGSPWRFAVDYGWDKK